MSNLKINKVKEIISDGLPFINFEVKSAGENCFSIRFLFSKDGREPIKGHFYSDEFNRVKVESIFVNDLPDLKLKGSGVAKKILSNLYNVGKFMESKSIFLEARGVGAYFFAKAGFVPSEHDLQFLSKKIAIRLDGEEGYKKDKAFYDNILKAKNPEGIYDIANSYLGKKALAHLDWDGSLDINNPQHSKRLLDYTKLSLPQKNFLDSMSRCEDKGVRNL